jgi:hypothetical protein
MKLRQIALTAILTTLLAGCGEDNADPTPAVSAEPTATLTLAATPSPAVEQQAMAAVTETEGCPTLRIVSPNDGDEVAAPVEAHYEISGVAIEPGKPLFMRISIVGLPELEALDVPLEELSGVITIPDDKLLTGVRDIRIELLDATHEPFSKAKTEVIVHQLLITGGR